MALRRESCAAAAARSSVFGAPPPGKGGALAAELAQWGYLDRVHFPPGMRAMNIYQVKGSGAISSIPSTFLSCADICRNTDFVVHT